MPSHPPFERPPRRAVAELSAEKRAAWRTGYLNDEGTELRVLALMERTEAGLRAAGAEVTIRTLWLHLAERATAENTPDLRAAAALAGMAMGLG